MVVDVISWTGWNAVIAGNTLAQYLWACGYFVVLSIIFFIGQKVVMVRIKHFSEKTKTSIDNMAIRMIESFRPPIAILISLYFATQSLEMNGFFRSFVDVGLALLVTYQVVSTIRVVITFLVTQAPDERLDAHGRMAIQMLGSIIMGAVWVFGGLVVLSNLGINVTSLLAGVGIGGIAIAFALQSILKDLFSSFSLYFEKPFSVGDFIVVGEHSGTVRSIGVKTTRIKSLGGEEIIISNSELTSSRVQNFKKMKRRRVSKLYGVTYDTPNSKMKQIPSIMENIISEIEGATFSRAHFKSFEESALTFECVYFVETSDYDVYMNVKQEFNLKLKHSFEQKGIEFAFPTRTVYMTKSMSDM